jgi:cytochrome c biogenesis protein CcmG/thiol:disulfide interchange protein DsbE
MDRASEVSSVEAGAGPVSPPVRTDNPPLVQEPWDQGLLNHNEKRMARRTKIVVSVLAIALVAGLTVWGISSGGNSVDSGAGNPASAAVDYDAALADAPPALAKLYADGDALIPGGLDAFQSQLAQLNGHPVIVNLWASWCGPCRSEFPDFQRVSADRGDEVAFFGVNALDTDPAAESFLEELPLPYPSVTDPDQQVKAELGVRGYPATAFFDANGKLVHLKQGPYTSADELNADIDRFAS